MDLITNNLSYLIYGSAAAAIIYGLILVSWIVGLPKGDDKMNAIARAIQEGARAYLLRQYAVVAIVALILSSVIYQMLGLDSAIGFLIGAVASALAGLIGML